MTVRGVSGFLLSLSAVLLANASLSAQGTSSLRGTVSDQLKAVVPFAKITLSDKDNGTVRAAITQDGGQYQFLQLRPGSYLLRVEAPGLSPQQVDGIRLLVDTPATIDVTLQVAATSSQVNVTADAVQLNTVDATVGNAFEQHQVSSLPIQTRNAAQLLSLQPGVTQNGEVMGARRDQNNITLDGVDANDNQNALSGQNGNNQGGLPAPNSNPTATTSAPTSGFNAALPVPLDSVQEFRVTVAGNGAADGHSSGGQVSLITRSGTNTLHGSAYEYNRNTAYTANNWFNNRSGLARPQLIRNQFGASLGGPVKKDHLFLFANYERRLDNSQQTQTRTVPSESLKQGIVNFQSTSGTTYTLSPAQVKAADPLGIGITQGMLNLLQKYPVGNAPALGADQGLNFSGYLFNAPVQLDYRTYVSKMDWAIDGASKHNVSFRGTLSNQGQTNLAAQLPGQSAASQLLSDNRGFGARYTAVLTPTITNTANVGLTRIGYGITGSSSTGLTFGNVSPLENFTRGSSRINPNWNFTDDLNWSKGTHTFTAGVNLLRFNNTINNYNNSFQSYSFGRGSLLGLGADINANVLDVIGQPNLKLANGTALTTAMGDVLGILTGGSVTYNYQKDGSVRALGEPTKFNFLSRTYGFYLQDSWKVNPRLTVTYGLRYEYATPPYESTGLQVVPSTGLDKLFADRVYAADNGIPGNQLPGAQLISYDLNGPANSKASWFRPDKNNFAPRFSVAYAPDGKTSIRAGASMVYDQFGNDLAAQVASSGSLGLATTKSFPVSYNFTTAPRYSGSDLPALPSAPAGGFPFTPTLNRAISGSSYGMSPDLVAPYALLANVSVARQLSHGITLDVGYVGRFAHKLLLQQNIGTPLLNFKDNKSGMTFVQADGVLRSIYDTGVTANQVKANPSLIPLNPFAENMFPGLQNYYFPGSASSNYFYGIYGQYAGSDLDNLHALDRVTSSAFPNCIVVTGCFTFFLPQASSLPTWFNAGNSNYHALTATLRRSLQNGLSFDINYTWSHSIDNASVAASGAGSAGGVITNAYAPAISRNSSDFDLRHQINANFVYELPFGRGRPFLSSAKWWQNEVVGGWQVSSIMHMQSGLPSVIGGSGAYSSNYNQSNQTIPKGAGVPTGAVQFDQFGYPSLFTSTTKTSSYQDYYPGGTATRGIVRMPWQRNVDAAVVKNFTIPWEHQSLQFRAEAFNVFNFVNFTNVSLSISSPGTFGEFTAASDARVLQLALRYSF